MAAVRIAAVCSDGGATPPTQKWVVPGISNPERTAASPRELPIVSAGVGSRTSSVAAPIGGSRHQERVAPFVCATESASRSPAQHTPTKGQAPPRSGPLAANHTSAKITHCDNLVSLVPQELQCLISDAAPERCDNSATQRARPRRGMSGRSPNLARPRRLA